MIETVVHRKKKRPFNQRDLVLQSQRAPSLPFGSGGPCDRLELCGSCPLLPLSYDAQLAWKLQDLQKNLELYPSLANVMDLIRVAPHEKAELTPRGYRHTVKPSVRSGPLAEAPLQIGLYQPGSHQLVDLSGCIAQTRPINTLLELIRELAPKCGLRAFTPGDELVDNKRSLRYLVAREGLSIDQSEAGKRSRSVSIYLSLIVTQIDRKPIDELISMLSARCPELSGVAVHVNRLSGNAIFDVQSPTTHHWGDPTLYAEWKAEPTAPSLIFQISAASFTQVNPKVAELAYQEVIRGLHPQPGEVAIDLYCGGGAIGILLASQARQRGGPLAKLIGFEESSSSIFDARQNATRHGIDESEWVLGRVEDQLTALYESNEGSQARELIVALNPSRRGCQVSVLSAVTRLKPRKIAYMSCHAKTLARDLSRLTEQGYEVESISLFDMFPGSVHYETVSVLHRSEGVSRSEVRGE